MGFILLVELADIIAMDFKLKVIDQDNLKLLEKIIILLRKDADSELHPPMTIADEIQNFKEYGAP